MTYSAFFSSYTLYRNWEVDWSILFSWIFALQIYFLSVMRTQPSATTLCIWAYPAVKTTLTAAQTFPPASSSSVALRKPCGFPLSSPPPSSHRMVASKHFIITHTLLVIDKRQYCFVTSINPYLFSSVLSGLAGSAKVESSTWSCDGYSGSIKAC